MLLLIELLMLVAGLWGLLTGRFPQLLLGGGKYQIEGTNARLLGLLLISPLPLSFLGGILLILWLGEPAEEYVAMLEIALIFIVLVVTVVAVRLIGKPTASPDSAETIIAKKANGALIYALLSVTGIGAIIFCPLAFVYAGQALRLIDEHPDVGEAYRRKAQTARLLAGVITLLWALMFACLVSLTFAV